MSKHWRVNQGLNKPSFGTAPNCCENRKLCRDSWLLLSPLVAQCFCKCTFLYFQHFNYFVIVKVNPLWEILLDKLQKTQVIFVPRFRNFATYLLVHQKCTKRYTVECGVDFALNTFHSNNCLNHMLDGILVAFKIQLFYSSSFVAW